MELKRLQSNLVKTLQAAHLPEVVNRFVLPSKSLRAPEAENHSAPADSKHVSPVAMFTHFLQNYYNSHEGLVGVDITPGHIRICQMEESHDTWKLVKLASTEIPGHTTKADINENMSMYVSALNNLIKNNKIVAKNVAISIPVSDSIIKTLTLPKMTDEEIEMAIEMGSFWQNLVQLPGELEEYSVFHEVVKREEDEENMDILFVGSRIDDVAAYSSIIAECGLNPLIVDVRCFALNNIFNINSHDVGDKSPVVFLKFGPDENYIHIIDNGESFLYDIYISDEERRTIMDHFNDAEILQRYASQAKQIISSHENRVDNGHKVKNIFVVSLLPAIGSFVNKLSVILNDYNISECNFFDHLEIPEEFRKKIESEDNVSAWAVAMGLAARRFDIFDENKGVIGADNVNLLPGNEEIKETKKVKLLSFASLAPIAAICLIIAAVSFVSLSSESNVINTKLNELGFVDTQHSEKTNSVTRLSSMNKRLSSLEDIKAKFASNQDQLINAYKQINGSIPEGVWLNEMVFEKTNILNIKGNSMSDQNVLSFIKELKASDVFEKVSLKTLNVDQKYDGLETMIKAFELICILNKEEAIPDEGGGGES